MTIEKDQSTQVEMVVTDHSSSDRARLAAEHLAYEKTLTFWQTLRIFWKAVLWTAYGQLVVFGYGIDGIVAGYLLAIPEFRKNYGELYGTGPTAAYIIPATWQSLYGGVAQLAGIIGAYGTGWLAERIGRRYTNLCACLISVVGVGVQYASTRNGSLGLLTAGKAINGFPIGMWLVIGPLYASEVAPLKLRGWLTAITNLVQFCGVLLFTGIMYEVGPMNNSNSYVIPIVCQWAIPSIVILTIWVWPESPIWLVRRQRGADAMKSIVKLYGGQPSVNLDAVYALIELSLAAEDEQRATTKAATYRECFQKKDRSRTLISMFIYGCQYLSGLVFVLGYQSYYYQLVGYDAKKSFLLGMLNNVSMFIANILSWFLLSAFGRRPLIVWGQFMCAIALFIIGGASLPGTHSAYLVTISFMFIWGFIYQITLGTVAWTVVAEIPSLRLRSRTQGLANVTLCFVQWLIGFVFPYMFNPDSGNLGGKVGFIFGATTFIGFLGTWLYLPETKDRTPMELDALYERRINPRHFDKVQVEI